MQEINADGLRLSAGIGGGMKVRILLTAVFFSASVMLQAAPFDLADSFDKEGTLFEKLTPANLQNNSILKAGSCFKWLSYKRDAARYQALRRKNITFFSEVVPEAIVRFKDGKLNRVYISVYNKGDSEPITDEKDFELKIEALAKKLSEKTGVRSQENQRRLGSRAKVKMRVWNTPVLSYQLRWSSSDKDFFLAEYILVTIERSQGAGENNTVVGKVEKSASQLSANVKKTPANDVYIDGIPMVDQGAKGYCVPAVVERIMKYYGSDDITQHTIAQIAGTSNRGTNAEEMYNSLKRISNRLGCRLNSHYSFLDDIRDFRSFMDRYNGIARKNKAPTVKIVTRGDTVFVGETLRNCKPDLFEKARMDDKREFKKFRKRVHDFIDKGIPVIWCVPGHMRMIIGYNDNDSMIVFSDTWGAKYEFQKMKMDKAWAMTQAMYTLEPRKK